jgi:hypothetical protein
LVKTVFYGVEEDPDFPVPPKHVRAINHFGYYSFSMENGKVVIRIMSQTDPKVSIKSPMAMRREVLKTFMKAYVKQL